MDDPTCWKLIEDYFLGRTADVEELLGVDFFAVKTSLGRILQSSSVTVNYVGE